MNLVRAKTTWDPRLHPRHGNGRFREVRRPRRLVRVIRANLATVSEHRTGWSEADHPRDDKGKFAPKGTGGGGSVDDAIANGESYKVRNMSEEYGLGSVNEVMLVEFEGGAKGVWKQEWDTAVDQDVEEMLLDALDEEGGSGDLWLDAGSYGWEGHNQATAEVLYSGMDQELGWGTAPKTRWFELNGEMGSLQDFARDADVASEVAKSTREGAIWETQGQRIAALDYVMTQGDRHTNNWLVDYDSGVPIAIDNGRSWYKGFPPPGLEQLINANERRVGPFEAHWRGHGLSRQVLADLANLDDSAIARATSYALMDESDSQAFVMRARLRINDILAIGRIPEEGLVY